MRHSLHALALSLATAAALVEVAPLELKHITCNLDQSPRIAETQSCRDSVNSMLYNMPERCCNTNTEGSRCTTIYDGLEGGCALSLCGFQGCMDCALFGNYMAAAADHCAGPDDPEGSTITSTSMTMDAGADVDGDVRLVISSIGQTPEEPAVPRSRNPEILALERMLLLSPQEQRILERQLLEQEEEELQAAQKAKRDLDADENPVMDRLQSGKDDSKPVWFG